MVSQRARERKNMTVMSQDCSWTSYVINNDGQVEEVVPVRQQHFPHFNVKQ